MGGWRNPRWNEIKDPIYRHIFQSLEEWTAAPRFDSFTMPKTSVHPYYDAALDQNIQPAPVVVEGDRVAEGALQSSTFTAGSAGWQIKADGTAEFNGVTVRGNIAGGTIDVGGFDSTSFHVDVNGNAWWGAATYATAPLKVENDGTLISYNGSSAWLVIGGGVGLAESIQYFSGITSFAARLGFSDDGAAVTATLDCGTTTVTGTKTFLRMNQTEAVLAYSPNSTYATNDHLTVKSAEIIANIAKISIDPPFGTVGGVQRFPLSAHLGGTPRLGTWTGQQTYTIGGSTVVTTSAAGLGLVNFPTTVTGVFCLVHCNGDFASGHLLYRTWNMAATGFNVIVTHADTGALGASILVRIDWMAIVW